MNRQARPFAALSAVELAQAIHAGDLDPETLARACLDRIAEREPLLKAWAYLDPAEVLRRARELAKRPSLGPLHGVPVAIKDVIDTADMPTDHNSPLYNDHRPGADAPCVETLRAAGALIIGKTETTEFAAAGRNPCTRNPHDATRTSGGSSAGSAAAVADGQVPLALGTQTGGSTMRPASFCGAYALKPTWGTVSREGVKLYSLSLDTVSWYGRSVADLDLVAAVFGIGAEPVPPPPVAGLRIALCRSPEWQVTEPSMRAAFDRAGRALGELGAGISMLDLPDAFSRLSAAHKVILFSEGRAAFLNLYRNRYDLLHEDFRHRVENRDGFSNEDLVAAYDLSAQCRMAFDGIAADYDAILTPSAPGEAPVGTGPGNPALNQIWTLLHVPCVNLPLWRGESGLPLGLTLTGPRFADRRLLGVARAIEAALAPEM
ncbi:amidase [Labrys monachus]|uniref:Asp-tRNA(Asn)/Glu-tRNA(Gln) amidotransferase A subunit family amidase n=1 Tax=Labrys monachus TaxID=217067 RepID=A0ABU0FFF8_9HYPH|nr:amidase [Labrys monachus]MDQ0393342.1 Asp-tRNA(Asn)/Glu-tRNA(Gln) amidotransferase A subunit family amidase [Labrys monachus]